MHDRDDCILNENILTEPQAPDEEIISSSMSMLSTKSRELFPFRRKKKDSATDENYLILPLNNAVESRQDVSTTYGVCGVDVMPQDDGRVNTLKKQLYESQKQLRDVQAQVDDLNAELDLVQTDKEVAVAKLDKMIGVSNKKEKIMGVSSKYPVMIGFVQRRSGFGQQRELIPELREIRMMLTTDGTESTLTLDQPASPFCGGVC